MHGEQAYNRTGGRKGTSSVVKSALFKESPEKPYPAMTCEMGLFSSEGVRLRR
jgi:hypothetical protein